jgi:nucleotide-binding universal stress UspA family protein
LSDATEPNMQATVTSVALKSHKPVVAVPEECRGFDAAGCAVVAWDGSAAAMAAVTAALPLLRIADQVVLLEVKDEKRTSSAEEAASYLSRHDIRSIVYRTTTRNIDRARHILVAEEIMMTCEEHKAAYCVMGAFGHSPIREAIVGGVTRAMLASSPIPLVLAH